MSTINKLNFKVNGHKLKVNVERYSSAQEVVQDCKIRTITDSSFNDMKEARMDMDFEGVHSYDEALELMNGGYQPTVKKLETALKASRVGEGKRITFQNGVAGFAPVVPLALKGVPNSMVTMTMKPIKCKVIDVYYDIGVSCSVSSEQIIENGQKVLQAILELESQGYRFNLYAVQSYNDSVSSDVLCVKIKSSDKPLDLKRISFPLTHPAFFRVIGFDWYSKFPVGKYRGGYGKPLYSVLSSKKEIDEFAKNAFGENAIYVSGSKIGRDGVDHLKEVFAGENKSKG